MRMHSRPYLGPRLDRATQGNILAASLPFLFAAAGLIVIGVALVLQLAILVLAGAGMVVIAGAMYLISKAVERSYGDPQDPMAHGGHDTPGRTGKQPLPPRGPLADAAVDALTRHDGPGGVWPPLSGKRPAQEAADPSVQEDAARSANGVSMWDPHGQVGPQSFKDERDAPRWDAEEAGEDDDQAMLEFQRADAPVRGQPQTTTNAFPPQAGRPSQAPVSPMDRDFRVWPGAHDAGQWDRWSGRAKEERTSDQRRMASMEERRKRLAERLPTVGAILASPEKDEDPPRSGATRGKCSSCQHYLWAPQKRPITLKCPACGHKARLY